MKYTALIILFLMLCFSCQEDSTIEITELEDLGVMIVDPLNYESTTPNSPINFRGIVTGGDNSNFTNLRVNWLSDIDGLLYESNLTEAGETTFYTSELSKNIHHITLNVINEVDSIISDSIEIYNALKLFPIETTDNSSTIKWCALEDSSFESFQLYRSRYKNGILQDEPIYTTTSIQDTTYVDTTAILGEKHFYKVFMNRAPDLPERIGSNFDSIVPGKFLRTNYPILKLISDPQRNYAYGIINTSSIYSDNETGYGLIFINLDEFEIESRILQDVRFSDLEIDPTGNNLYACSRSSTIHRINLNTRSLESTFSLARSAHKIEIGNNGKLYYHVTPPSSGSTEFRIYDLETNSNVPYSTGIVDAYANFRHGDFQLGDDNIIYHGGSNSSGSTLSKIGTVNETFSLIDYWNSGNYQSEGIVLNNNKLYWNHFLLDLNLNILGTFQSNGSDIDVQDVSTNGFYALGWRNIFNTGSQSIHKELPVYYDSGIFIDNDVLLIHKTENPLSQQYSAKIFQYSF
jgi:hypothetical protein